LKPMLPGLFEVWKPHMLAGMSEVGMETLDMKELETACVEAFADYAMSLSEKRHTELVNASLSGIPIPGK
jgi:hypothetical protein